VSTKWFEIPLDVLSEHADEAVALLTAEGFAGCEVREGPERTRLVVFAEARDADAAALRARAARAAVARFAAGDSCPADRSSSGTTETADGPATEQGTTGIAELDPAVWTDNWRRHFSRRTFADRIEILPPWESPSPPEAGLLSIVINPGMAFGTGLHETTASCLELLVELVRPGDTVADVGCGSGILALAAVRLGADHARASDVDPLAVDAALENAERNGLQGRVAVGLAHESRGPADGGADGADGVADGSADGGADGVADGGADGAADGVADGGADGAADGAASGQADAPFDLVVANILAETLVELRQRLTVAVREGGVLILSGIEAGRLDMVLDAFLRPGWTLLRRVQKGEWATVAIERTVARATLSASRRTLLADTTASATNSRARQTTGTPS